MEKNRTDEIRRINYLTTETDRLYHLSSLKLGISDSVSLVLYALLDAGGQCLLGDIYKNSGVSKQTLNSAIRSLEREGMLYLKPYRGRAKMVLLTEKGQAFSEKTAARLRQAELDALASWPEEEIRTHIRLLEKYAESFRKEIENL